MLPEQKRAWFTLGAFGLTAVAFGALALTVGVAVAPAGFALFGLTGLTPLLFRKKADVREVDVDERDKMIAQKATLGAGIASFEAAVLLCMGAWFAYMLQGKEAISIHILPMVVFVTSIVLWTTRAIVVVVMYGREPNHVQD